MDWTLEDLAAAIRPRRGRSTAADPAPRELTIVDATAREHDVLVSFWWKSYPHLLALGLGPESEYDDEVESPAHWASDAVTLIGEEMNTGRFATSRRTGGDVIELGPREWPDDRRFYLQAWGPHDGRVMLPPVEQLDAGSSTMRNWIGDGSLAALAWAYVNNRSGTPNVGWSAARWTEDGVASLEHLVVEEGIPDAVWLDLALVVVHVAAENGARTIHTDLDDPLLDTLGFAPAGSRRTVDTRFLDLDFERARLVHRAGQDWRPPSFVRDALRSARRLRRRAV